jgi:hypothetical protein
MRRESHIRICEGLGVQFPGSTRRLTTMGGTIAQSVSRYSATLTRPSDDGASLNDSMAIPPEAMRTSPRRS